MILLFVNFSLMTLMGLSICWGILIDKFDILSIPCPVFTHIFLFLILLNTKISKVASFFLYIKNLIQTHPLAVEMAFDAVVVFKKFELRFYRAAFIKSHGASCVEFASLRQVVRTRQVAFQDNFF